MKASDYLTLDTALNSSGLAREIRRLEEAQRAWARNIEPLHSVADQLRQFTESNPLAVQMAQQFHDMDMQRMESIRKMLDPIADIRKNFVLDASLTKMLEGISKRNLVNDELAEMVKKASQIGYASTALQDSMQSSLARAQEMIAATSITNTFSQVMKTYEEAQKRWIVPAELVGSIGALTAMQEQLGKLTLPVMDWASAATLAKVLGPEGLAAQLAALGISPDGTISEETLPSEDASLGINRRALDLMTLLGFILAILVPIYQELSSREWQQQTDKKLEAQSLMLEAQAKRFEALSGLVEKAIVQEAKRAEERFVVLERVAVVRRKPESGATVVGKLLPREVVRPISEQGKWIQFEYYHWLMQEYQIGWALKKYFKRVLASRGQDNSR